MKKSNKGFSLIEVLITVLVLSVGLLSIAKLQIYAKTASYGSVQRTLANGLLQEMADRMRANATDLAGYTANGAGISLTATPSAAAADADVAVKTTATDLINWFDMLTGGAEQGDTGGLVSPTACISGPGGGAGIYTLSIAWRGVSKLINSSLNDCGNISGATDADIYGSANEYRRIMTIDIFISPAGFGV